MMIKVKQHHIDHGIKLSTADPFALAIREELDKRPTPAGYLRVERVVSVTSHVIVAENRIIKRKGREEVDTVWETYRFADDSPQSETWKFLIDFGNGKRVEPIEIELIPVEGK